MPAVATGARVLVDTGWVQRCHAPRTTKSSALYTAPNRGFHSLFFDSPPNCSKVGVLTSPTCNRKSLSSSMRWLNCCQKRSPCTENCGVKSLT